MIQYSKDSVTRAKNAMDKASNVIRIGSSPMTPSQFLIELWPQIHKHCPDIRFQLVQFENTPENAREILKNLGQNIDIVAGIFDDLFLKNRGCCALELSKSPVQVAISTQHHLAKKDKLTIQHLYGERLMLIRRGWNGYVDLLRDEIWQKHSRIEVIDFDFYSLEVFNQCQNSNYLLMTIDNWKQVHPLLKMVPIEWEFQIPFGIMHGVQPSQTVERFLRTVELIVKNS